MKILAHRGYWTTACQNSLEAFEMSLSKGYGFEFDIRDYAGNLVVSHDIAVSSSPYLRDVFSLLQPYKDLYSIALNIKSDGLETALFSLLDEYRLNNYFAFDMSVPQMLPYLKKKLRIFSRQSELEIQPVLYSKVQGVWMDSFYTEDWITSSIIKKHIENGKLVCLVSPELHKRNHNYFWTFLRSLSPEVLEDCFLCTDFPDEANEFFGS